MTTGDPSPAQATASVLLLCGLPASGKSSFARRIIELHEKHCCKRDDHRERDKVDCKSSKNGTSPKNIPIIGRYEKILLVDYDSITQQELLSRDDKSYCSSDADLDIQNASFNFNELGAWRKSRVTALEILKDALTNHFRGDDTSSLLIIMDDNFHLRSMRRDVYRSCQEILAMPLPSVDRHSPTRIGFSTAYFSTPHEVCLKRNGLRRGKERIPVDVINRMAAVMEPPDETKPYASFESFHVSADSLHSTFGADVHIESATILHQIDECLQRALQSPVLPKNDLTHTQKNWMEQQQTWQREETLKCQVQRIDQLLRKLVGAVGRVDKKRSREANETRKTIMGRFRNQDDTFSLSDESAVRHFACSMLDLEVTGDWQYLDNPLIHSIYDAFHQFQEDRSA